MRSTSDRKGRQWPEASFIHFFITQRLWFVFYFLLTG